MKKIFILCFLVIIFYAACSSLSEQETLIVGNWRLVDYSDNLQRTTEETQDFLLGVEQQKRMMLAFYDDHSYVRSLDTQAEAGEWEIKDEGKVLVTKPTGSKDETRIFIDEITENRMMLRIVETVASPGENLAATQVITKMVWEKH